MQNQEQMRLIMNWERDHYRLGNEYKNKLAESWKNLTFSVVPKGAMKIEGDKTTIFKKRG